MYFSTIYENIIKKIAKSKDVKSLQNLQEKISKNKIYKYQFDLVEKLKEAKQKIQSKEKLDKFVVALQKDNYKFIKENNLSHVKIWKENIKLLEFFNISKTELVPNLIDKALDFNPNKKLNEQAIRKYILIKEVKENKTLFIKESLQTIKKEEDKLGFLKNTKIISFLSECLDKKNKEFIQTSVNKLKETSKKDFRESVDKLYKLRLLTEKLLKENELTDTLPDSIDHFLQDCAQMLGGFDYSDISKFAKKASKFDIKKVYELCKNIKSKPDEGLQDEEIKNSKEYKELISLIRFSETSLNEAPIDDEEEDEEEPRTSPGKRVMLPDLKYIKKIQVECPINYKTPSRIIVSFNIPLYPVGAYFKDLLENANDMNKKLSRFGRSFINMFIYQKDRDNVISPTGAIWVGSCRTTGISVNRPFKGTVDIYLNLVPGVTWEQAYKTIYASLKDYSDYIPEMFPDEYNDKMQKLALRTKDPNQARRSRGEAKPEDTNNTRINDTDDYNMFIGKRDTNKVKDYFKKSKETSEEVI